MTAHQTPRIRRMNRKEMDLAIDWAASEGWNPGLHDAECFYKTDPAGFFVAELNGEIVGSISAVAYTSANGFIGLYIVLPEHRGKGFGMRLWAAAMEYMGSRNVGLDGVLAQLANYERSGFTLAYRNVRRQGVGQAIGMPGGLVELEQDNFQHVLAYDARVFEVERPGFLRRWLFQPGGKAVGVLRAGALRGYGVVRPCREGFKIGPLFANDEAAAESIFLALSAHATGRPLFLDTPEANPQAASLAARHGMSPVFETVRMYNQGQPGISLSNVFGVTSFELG